MKQRNVVCECSEATYIYYAQKFVPFLVRVCDTDFHVVVARLGKRKIALFFSVLKQFYSYVVDRDKLNSEDVLFEYNWFYEYCKSIYQIYFNNYDVS